MTDTSLEARIRKLEDIEAIKKVTATYAHYVDKGWNGKEVYFDKLPLLFAKDASWKCAAMGADVSGIDNIVELLRGATAHGSFAMHSFTNPIIDVDGDSAKGKWLLWVGVKNGDAKDEVFQSEDLTYTRSGDSWVIQSIDLHFGQMLNA
jgi:hypothetical protein